MKVAAVKNPMVEGVAVNVAAEKIATAEGVAGHVVAVKNAPTKLVEVKILVVKDYSSDLLELAVSPDLPGLVMVSDLAEGGFMVLVSWVLVAGPQPPSHHDGSACVLSGCGGPDDRAGRVLVTPSSSYK